MVERFNKLFEHQLNRNHVGPRIQQLCERITYPASPEDQALYEKLDRMQVQAFKFADRNCRKLRIEEVPFASEVVQIEGRRISLWTLVIRRKAGCHVSTKTIKRLTKKCEISKPLQYDIKTAKRFRSEALAKYNKEKLNADVARDTWMQDMAQEKLITEGEASALLVNQRRQREERRRAHKKIKWARTTTFTGGTMKLTVVGEICQEGIEILQIKTR